jgi:hypothetical protein
VLKEDDDSTVHGNSSFSFQVKILNILHPQPEINLPIALFKLATIFATYGVSIRYATLDVIHLHKNSHSAVVVLLVLKKKFLQSLQVL